MFLEIMIKHGIKLCKVTILRLQSTFDNFFNKKYFLRIYYETKVFYFNIFNYFQLFLLIY